MNKKFTFAIGDIHGCYIELIDLIKKIDNFVKLNSPSVEHKIVFLGDYCDRGSDTYKVIDLLKNSNNHAILKNYEVVCLMGNHDQMMATGGMDWWRHWGKDTQQSYIKLDPKFESGIYYSHLEWLKNLPKKHYEENLIVDGQNLLFVHAGLQPGLSIEEQHEIDFMWIRDEFICFIGSFGDFKVIHGHTVVSFDRCLNGNRHSDPNNIISTPLELEHRINLDTACCYGGRLTAGVFENGKMINYLQSIKHEIIPYKS